MSRRAEPDRAATTARSELADLRAVHRAAAELRRGAPALITEGGATIAVLAAETAEPAALAEFRALCAGAPALLLAPRRAADLLAQEVPAGPVAAYLMGEAGASAPIDLDRLRAIADPTLAQEEAASLRALLRPAAMPHAAASAIRLAKIARLLPVVLAAPAAEAPGLALVSAAAIDAYPEAMTAGLRQVAEAAVPLDSAPDARVVAFRPLDGGVEHLAIIVGRPEQEPAPLVRLHSACLTGDILGSLRCDCGPQLRAALARMTESGAGVLLYLAQEGRGIGIVNKLRAYTLQDSGADTVDANLSLGWAVDERSFLPAAIMLEQLGLRRIRLMTNNPAKLAALAAHGIEIVAREPHVTPANGVNDAYLRAKADRLGHLLG